MVNFPISPASSLRFGKLIVDPASRDNNPDVAEAMERLGTTYANVGETLKALEQVDVDVFVWFPEKDRSAIQLRDAVDGRYLAGDKTAGQSALFTAPPHDTPFDHSMRLWNSAFGAAVKLLVARLGD